MKITVLISVACLLHACMALPPYKASFMEDSFIINGQEAKLGEFPHQLVLERRSGLSWRFSCGAVLISNQQALTAAHCVGGPANRYRVLAGVHDRTSLNNSIEIALSNITMHPSYNDGTATFSNDIAIATFATPISFSSLVQPIRWNDNNELHFAGKKCVLSGWGKTEQGGVSDPLKRVTMDIVSNQECQNHTIPSATIYPGHICAYQPVYGACSGDSGGPMTCEEGGKSILAGITSWVVSSAGTCDTDFPTTYARVSHFKKFILDHLVQ